MTTRDEMQKQWAHWAGEAHNAMAKLFELVVDVQVHADEAIGTAQSLFDTEADESILPEDAQELLYEANLGDLLERVQQLEDFNLATMLEAIEQSPYEGQEPDGDGESSSDSSSDWDPVQAAERAFGA